MPSKARMLGRARARRVGLRLIALTIMLAALAATNAQAAGTGVGTTEITCSHVTFTFEGFPEAENNTVNETITINKQTYATGTFTFNGPSGTNTVAIAQLAGKYLVDAHVTWKTNGISGGFDHHVKLDCAAPFTIEKLQEIAGSGMGFTKAELTGKVGQTDDYEILVKNVSAVPLYFTEFTDAKCDAGTIAGGPGAVAVEPGETTVYTCSHLLSGFGAYTNQATVTGAPEQTMFMAHAVRHNGSPDNSLGTTETSNPVVVNVVAEPAFTIEKLQEVSGSGSGYTKSNVTAPVGGTILYEIVVTNTGNVPLTFSAFTDSHCSSIAGGPGSTPLAPGESTTWTCSHTLTAKDKKAGIYENTATVKGTPPPKEGSAATQTSNPVYAEMPGGEGTTEITCSSVTFTYGGFPNAEGNTVTQEIRINKELVSDTMFTFNGPSGMDTVPIEVPEGKHIVDAHVTWDTNGVSGGFDHHVNIKCT
jgi:hypothetical protein